MYAVVGCSECANMWIITDPKRSKTANCSRCGRTHQTKKLRSFLETEDHDAARQARAALLAKKHGDSEAFAETAHVSEMEERIEESGLDDAEYLEGSGLDAAEIESAGERAMEGRSSSTRLDAVREAVREGDRPTEGEVVAYAEERGVPGDAARDVLEKLTRRGEASESRGRYRLL
ncbi:DUF5817 domain-containing protein [Halogeometricum luteum]|uniref:DUF5817 domain-containing protein n=1 Tax=Halogeometricum luteum TaxID=2950537 RepID=A0ABU2G0T0_9EURY|nr:DUF5817 domain-containing protein [Halogeometricum sp. S3BR5-2]MDS0294390.1 DUF5817 domain-containing protein [Halogeometricum sp. S3BR5-2]